MEAAAAGVVASGGARPSPSSPSPSVQPARKNWRAEPASGEEMDLSKLGQTDLAVYQLQQGSGAIEVDFCSVDAEILQQRYRDVARQRDELHHVETELRAQILARGEILEMRRSFGAQLSEHVTASAALKDQLQEKDQRIRELERKLDDKERELHMIKLDNEAAWAKENLFIEQDRELASYRIERDSMDAERANNLKQIHELNELINEKDARLFELEEQHRVDQEAILYKDERMREAQAWIARVQEVDALQSTANHNLQAELRERTEQINQVWMGWQRQVFEMERLHIQTVQQLRFELAEVKERSGLNSDDSRVRRTNSGGALSQAENGGDQFNGIDKISHNDSYTVQPNGHMNHSHGLVSTGVNTSQIEYVPGVPLLSTSLLGVGGGHPSGPMTGLHSYVIPQSPTDGHIPLPHMGHYSPVPAVLSQQYWPNQQVVANVSQISHYKEDQRSEIDANVVSADASNCELSETQLNSQHPDSEHAGHMETQIDSPGQTLSQVAPSSEPQEVEIVVPLTNSTQLKEDFVPAPTPANIHEMSSVSRQGSSVSDSGASDGPSTGQGMNTGNGRGQAPAPSSSTGQGANTGNGRVQSPAPSSSTGQGANTGNGRVQSPAPSSSTGQGANTGNGRVQAPAPASSTGQGANTGNGRAQAPAPASSTGQGANTGNGRVQAPALMDEGSLLACIVRSIPAGSGGQIRISTTLPNRLGKMLAPLHWHDYRKHYGKLNELMARYPELFIIEGDFVRLRDGAQKIVSANTAAAKMAAAATSWSPLSSLIPSVSLTPVAPHHRQSSSGSNQSEGSEKLLPDQQSNVLENSKMLNLVKDKGQNGLPFAVIGTKHVNIHGVGASHSSGGILNTAEDVEEEEEYLFEVVGRDYRENPTVYAVAANSSSGGRARSKSSRSNNDAAVIPRR